MQETARATKESDGRKIKSWYVWRLPATCPDIETMLLIIITVIATCSCSWILTLLTAFARWPVTRMQPCTRSCMSLLGCFYGMVGLFRLILFDYGLISCAMLRLPQCLAHNLRGSTTQLKWYNASYGLTTLIENQNAVIDLKNCLIILHSYTQPVNSILKRKRNK